MLNKILGLLELKAPIDQKKSEAIIALATLVYQSDAKVKLSEQDMFAKYLDNLPWENSYISKEAFHRQVVAKSLAALKQDNLEEYLTWVVPALKSDPKALELLRELALADGNIAPQEAEILKQISSLMA